MFSAQLRKLAEVSISRSFFSNRLLCWLVLALLWNAGQGSAQTTPDFPLAALREGLEGYAITAGAGNVLERFPVTVLSLQHDMGLGFPLVLVRSHGDFIERSGGVAAGMSGSPVYLPYQGQDALLGAIGYVFPNSDHRLALITPIEVMRQAQPLAASDNSGDNPSTSLTALDWAQRSDIVPFGQPFDASQAVPVQTPLLLSGVSARAQEHAAALFARSNVSPMPLQLTGQASQQDDEAFVLEPGSAVGVQLVRGDITIAAVGTLTLIEDDAFWAFGHSLLGEGGVSFALAPAYVSHIVSSNVVPFKLSNNGQRLLGSVTQDRPFAISGILDREPAYIPISLTLNLPHTSLRKTFEVSADERYYSPLLAIAILQAMDEALSQVGAGSSEIAWEISLATGESLRMLEQITHGSDIAGATAAVVASPLAILADNPFADPQVSRINLNVRYEPNQRYAEIVEVLAENSQVRPGGVLIAYVRLQPFRSDPEVKTLRIPLPEALEGEQEIVIRGGLEGLRSNGESSNMASTILSFNELLVALRDRVQASELVVEVEIDGEMERLERISLPYMVRGSKPLTITIADPDANDTDALGETP